jgi:Rad3-related DNA helicase
MLSPRAIYGEIFRNDEAFRLFCSVAASGEAQGGWENGRIAALVPESCRDLAPKIARHGADEDKHGRIFNALLRKRSLSPAPVPADTDYTMRLEGMGIGLAHSKLRADRQLTEADIIVYLAHSRVTEQRASEQMRSLRRYSTDADVSRAVTVISADEDNHLAYCHEELLRLAATGHRREIESILRTTPPCAVPPPQAAPRLSPRDFQARAIRSNACAHRLRARASRVPPGPRRSQPR